MVAPRRDLEETSNKGEVEHDRERIQQPIENDFYDVLRLQSHCEDWDEEENKDWNKQARIVLSLLQMAGLTEVAHERGGELKVLTAQDIKRLISALESNAFGMFDRTKRKPVCFGRGQHAPIYPVASFFNHSCECNSTAVQAEGFPEEITDNDILGTVEVEGVNTEISSAVSAPESRSGSVASWKAEDLSEGYSSTKASGTENEGPKMSPATNPYDTRFGEFRMMTFFSIMDIAKGRDITISYIDSEVPLQARRLALLSDYHFHCCCERCLREEKMTGSSKKTSKESEEKRSGQKKGGGGKPKTGGGKKVHR
ncbi:hypothetical protein BGZ65_006954 [Modicella reniformis]|uniref:SET domain-containing protein n=1 Tax=Modicella reniformis TaxID=1440133 RepID=A0A9P6MB32_9FUNG|nr:hypothetical protein BGZ65_006954 [Modicella reniformis]